MFSLSGKGVFLYHSSVRATDCRVSENAELHDSMNHKTRWFLIINVYRRANWNSHLSHLNLENRSFEMLIRGKSAVLAVVKGLSHRTA